MTSIIIHIYRYFARHRTQALVLLITATAALVWSLTRLSYNEDITDFLPLDTDNRAAMTAYRNLSGIDRIYAIVSARNPENPEILADGVESLAENIAEADSIGWIKSVVKEIDLDRLSDIASFVYDNIPIFLTESDYGRIDSLLASPDYIAMQLAETKKRLMMPASSLLSDVAAKDPLNLFSPAAMALTESGNSTNFDTYNGYILTPDSLNAIVIIESVFGGQESDKNAQLMNMLEDAATAAKAENPALDIRYLGGPVVAVGNSDCIKHDSLLAVAVAGMLILALLIYAFRDVRNILLVVVSIGWGWLFAIGMIAIFYPSISIIVIGISSVIIGIAVNYPLHLIDHLKDASRPLTAMKEVVAPLVVGNITTVGAFLCLIPLNSPALHDLGLFSSLLLVGTILFVLIFLPHAVKIRRSTKNMPRTALLDRAAGFSMENNTWIVATIAILTIGFGYFSTHTEFDTDISHINYMTDLQKADMQTFQSLLYTDDGNENLYIVSSGNTLEEALQQNETAGRTIDSLTAMGTQLSAGTITTFLPSMKQQQRRLNLWNQFLTRHPALADSVSAAALELGFNPEAFVDFHKILSAERNPLPPDSLSTLASALFPGSINIDPTSGQNRIARSIKVNSMDAARISSEINATPGFHGICFDIKSISGHIANTIASNFNYIGIFCALTVFIFLWISLGNIELAIVSFIPMAISWIWILGIMGMLDMKFNLVNIILATFIFGQGDDYTIFMTEGLSYEYAYRRKLLRSYKKSIILSALIMFIGIGCLVFARHPAMRSLGEVTVVGMVSVVLMAYLFPPLLFNFLIRKNGTLRRQPLSFALLYRKLFCRHANEMTRLSHEVLDRYRYKGADIFRRARRRLRILRHNTEALQYPADTTEITVTDCGQGETALMLSQLYPRAIIRVSVSDSDIRDLIEGCAAGFAPNLTVTEPEHAKKKNDNA